MKDGKRIVRSIDVMQRLKQSNDPVCKQAYKAWSNPDGYMDSKLDYSKIVNKGVSKFKSL